MISSQSSRNCCRTVVLAGPAAFLYEKRKHVLFDQIANWSSTLCPVYLIVNISRSQAHVQNNFEDHSFWWNNTYHLPDRGPEEKPKSPLPSFPASWTSAFVLEAGSWRHRTLAERLRVGDDWERSLDHPGHRVSRSGRKPNFRPQHGGENDEKTWKNQVRIFLGASQSEIHWRSSVEIQPACLEPVQESDGKPTLQILKYKFSLRGKKDRVFDAWQNNSQESVNSNVIPR